MPRWLQSGGTDMAVYALQIRTVSRRAGSSAVRYAAYRAGERLRDERARRVHDYTAKQDVQHQEIVAPERAPDWVRDREQLWNRVEARERRYDSRLAQEVYVAIPRELPPERRAAAVRDFVREHFVARGMVADFAIHVPQASDGGEHPHAHILLTTRPIERDGFGLKAPAWNHPREVCRTRFAWERYTNRALVRAGSLERVDARSLAVQRKEVERYLDRAIAGGDRAAARRFAEKAAALDREPEPALGRAASEMEKKGRRTQRGDLVREVRKRNLQSHKRRLRMRLREAERGLRRRELQLRFERVVRRLGIARTGPERPRVPEPVFCPPSGRQPEIEPAMREFLDRLPDPLERCRAQTADTRHAGNAALGRCIEEILARGGSPMRDPDRVRELREHLDRQIDRPTIRRKPDRGREMEQERE